MLLVGRTEAGRPNAGQTTENLDSITAVVSLFGGHGTIIATLIRAVIVGVFRNRLPVILIRHDMPHVVELADRIQNAAGQARRSGRAQSHSMPEAVAIMTGAAPGREARE